MGFLNKLFAANAQTATKALKTGVSASPDFLAVGGVDVVPGGIGRFGWDKNNPVPCAPIFSEKGADLYLSWLMGEDSKLISAARVGSHGVEGMPGMVDCYQLNVGDARLGLLYICPYFKRNSRRVPWGLLPSGAYFDAHAVMPLIFAKGLLVRNHTTQVMNDMRKAMETEDRMFGVDVCWWHLATMTVFFELSKRSTHYVKDCILRLYPEAFSDIELSRFETIASAIQPVN